MHIIRRLLSAFTSRGRTANRSRTTTATRSRGGLFSMLRRIFR